MTGARNKHRHQTLSPLTQPWTRQVRAAAAPSKAGVLPGRRCRGVGAADYGVCWTTDCSGKPGSVGGGGEGLLIGCGDEGRARWHVEGRPLGGSCRLLGCVLSSGFIA